MPQIEKLSKEVSASEIDAEDAEKEATTGTASYDEKFAAEKDL